MKISHLFNQHRHFQGQGLVENFGDGYLVSQNRVFRFVRSAALQAGYRFSTQRHEAYDAFPLLQLENILQARVLPYSNNVVPFENLSAIQRELMVWEDVDGNLKRNFVFHEGSHAVFRSLKPLGSSSEVTVQVLWMLLEESFANTMELLGAVDAGDATHRIFYELNSYVSEFEIRHHLQKALADMGEGILIPFFVLAYLHANFLRERIEDKDLQAMLALLGVKTLSDSQRKALRALSKVVFNLSARFRYQTTDFHLRLAGVKAPLGLLQKTEFLNLCAQDDDILELLRRLSKLRFEVVA